jgi:hypothetical protein
VHDVFAVQHSERLHNLDKNSPDGVLCKRLVVIFHLGDFLVQVSVVREIHH